MISKLIHACGLKEFYYKDINLNFFLLFRSKECS